MYFLNLGVNGLDEVDNNSISDTRSIVGLAFSTNSAGIRNYTEPDKASWKPYP